MKLRIKKITLKNFKTFKDITINPNSDFNIIIGENSAGKSTIFEAIHMWEKCYQTYILSSKKGFYKVQKSTNRYVNYQDLDFLRITKDVDLFYDPKHPELAKCAEITIQINNAEADESWSLGFRITCPTSIEDAFYRVQPIEESEFSSFATTFCSTGKFLDEAFFIYQTRPVSGVHQFEPYFNDAQIKKRIQKGLSHEVLRNKLIAKRSSISQLETSISTILQKDIKFDLPPKTHAKTAEFISIKVSIDGEKKQDLHLQGSGFLQIVEILSTVEFLDAPLKLLLVDEPDSHIHSKLQRNLLSHLRGIEDNQFFIISHNDQFVNNAGDGEVFFLNEENKQSGKLNPIDKKSFDIIKKTMGGVIISLESLNQASHIAFVEGSDDEAYLKDINGKLINLNLNVNSLDKISFFPLRGKDNICDKIEYNKRTLSTLFKDKKWHVIFDQDFSTPDIDSKLKTQLKNKQCEPFSHSGYCIESVLFSDITILKKYISSLTTQIKTFAEISDIVDKLIDSFKDDALDTGSELNRSLNSSFDGQKNNRPEYQDLQFTDVMRSWTDNYQGFKVESIMSKPQIKNFVLNLEQEIGSSLFLRKSNDHEEISSALLREYINFISDLNDLYPSFKKLFKELEIM